MTYAAVGRALSAWEKFETEFGFIFCYLTGSEHNLLPIWRAYGSIVTFRGRKEMLQEAAEMFLFLHPDPATKSAIDSLVKRADGFCARRNEIAHGVVMPYQLGSGPPRGTGFILAPARYASIKVVPKLLDRPDGPPGTDNTVFLDPRYVYSSLEIDAFTAHFSALEREATATRILVWQHRDRSVRRAKPSR
jgi:hypothetical protein